MNKGIKIFIEISIGILIILLIIFGIRYVKQNNLLGKEEIVSSTEVNTVEEPKEDETQKELNENVNDEINQEIEEGISLDPVEEAVNQEVNMVFTGDVLLTGYLLSQYDNGGVNTIVSNELLSEMTEANLCVVNEEFPFSNRGVAAEDKQFTFRIDPARVNVFNDMGIDLVSLANNHTLDYGEEALSDTFDTLDNAGIDYMGAGRDINEARALKKYEINGKNIGLLCASRVIPVAEWAAGASKMGVNTTYDPTNLIADIKSAKENCDLIIVYVHWGIEKAQHPEDYQRTMAKQYIDAGADVVIGSHPHVLQGIEYYNGKPIVYSLGNYIFGKAIEKTALLKVVLNTDDTVEIKIIPCKTDGEFRLNIADNKEDIFNYIESISYDVEISEEGIVSPK